MSSRFTRRDLFSLLARPFGRRVVAGVSPGGLGIHCGAAPGTSHAGPGGKMPPSTAGETPAATTVAVIQGRHCLALTSFCAACVERCPVAGAIQLSDGMPQVVPDLCTGCGICHQVCPAPTNAVLLLPRRRMTSRPSTLAST